VAVSGGQDLRRERQLRWVLRLGLLGLAAVLIAVAWQRFRAENVAEFRAPTPVRWQGRTVQGQLLQLQTIAGRPISVRTTIALPCNHGRPVTATIAFGSSEIRQDGSGFRAVGRPRPLNDDGRAFTLRASFDTEGGSEPSSGKVQANVLTDDLHTWCRSGIVRFTARRAIRN
jgi:hypothetical protein